MKRIMGLFLLLVSETVVLTALGWAGQDSWDFQKRTEDGWAYKEGVKGAPVSGHQVGIELLAVEAVHDGYQAKQLSNSETVKVRFCQPGTVTQGPKEEKIRLTFKELQDFEHYVLDGAARENGTPAWKAGCENIFPWRTQLARTIVGDLSNIGAVILIEQKENSAETFVLPAFLYQEHHGCPRSLAGYRIVLRSVRSGGIVAKVLSQDNVEKLTITSRLKGGMPFSFLIDLKDDAKKSEGWYVLDVQGVDSSIALRARLFHRDACRD